MRPVVLTSRMGLAVIRRNRKYARLAIRDCILRNETPVSAMMYLHRDMLNPATLADQHMARDVIAYWADHAQALVIYVDMGWDNAMLWWANWAHDKSLDIEERQLSVDVWPST